MDHDVDPLSPNNPLRTETLKPTQTEEEAALVEAFYQRVLEAEKILPRHVPLRLFRHGAECGEFFLVESRESELTFFRLPFRSEGRRGDCQEGEWMASLDGHIRYTLSSPSFVLICTVQVSSLGFRLSNKRAASPSREQRELEPER